MSELNWGNRKPLILHPLQLEGVVNEKLVPLWEEGEGKGRCRRSISSESEIKQDTRQQAEALISLTSRLNLLPD